MHTQTKQSIVLFVFLKYIVFFVFLMVLRDDYRLFSSGLIDGLTFFAIFMLPLPGLMALIFTYPLFYVFRLRKLVFFILATIGILCLEYFIYTAFASTQDLMNGVYNGLISVVLGFIFFGITKRITYRKTKTPN